MTPETLRKGPSQPPRPAPVTPAPAAPVDPRPSSVPPAAGAGLPLAYIAIPSLASLDVPARIEGMLRSAATAQGLILDLRGNGGGDGPVAVQVAGLFLGPGREVCTFWSRRGPSVQVTTRPAAPLPHGPPVILVDRQTASAAEILAAALREAAGAVLVGERTAGKGVGQKAILLADGSGLSFTRFRITSPTGQSWDGSGLSPDVEVGSAGGERLGADAALEAARGLILSRLSGATSASPSF